MQTSSSHPIVQLPDGQVRGLLRNGVQQFLGMVYGERVNPQSRTSQLKKPAPWAGVRDATAIGPVFPQLRSRLALVMGDAIDACAQSEDAFVVNVWAPEVARDLPVLFFIHGGGFVSGGGSAPWYTGERIAREEQIVVVTINYRLGALGHYTPDALPEHANNGVRDVLRALEWVQENIAAFGGDPAQVTVAGQSAGAWYAWLLGMSPAARGLLHRNILLSLPRVPAMSQELTQRCCQLFEEQCGGKSLDNLSIDELLQAQLKMMRALASFGDISLGFRPAVEEGLVPDDMFDFDRAVQNVHVTHTLVGATAEENAAFFFQSPDHVQASEQRVRDWFVQQFGSDAQQRYAQYAAARPQNTPYTQLVDASSAQVFGDAVLGVAKAMVGQQRTAFAYHFNVQSQVPHLMSPHCMELPFVFGNRQSWSDAPMLAHISPEVFERVSAAMRQAIGGFVRSGQPVTDKGHWPACSPAAVKMVQMTEDGASF